MGNTSCFVASVTGKKSSGTGLGRDRMASSPATMPTTRSQLTISMTSCRVFLETRNRVYCTLGAYSDFDQRITEWVKSLKNRASSGIRTPHEFVALDHVLHDMRLYKSRAEISALRKAAKIAVQAHQRAISAIRPGLFEYEVEAEYLREFRRHNATISYTPIVGSGANACSASLHRQLWGASGRRPDPDRLRL